MSQNIRKFLPWLAKRKPPKIVGLVPARNEGTKLPVSLKALACHTDAIIYLDDCSTDESIHHVEACRDECRIARVLIKDEWQRDEPADRNRLLEAGREIGGTHFIVIDADEVLTSNFLVQGHLRALMLRLSPGDAFSLPWIHLWQGLESYRVDGPLGAHHFKKCIFCDDGKGSYESDFIHTPRVPKMKGKRIRLALPYGLLHFQCLNWENVCQKQKWYRWMERIERPERSREEIIARYQGKEDESGLRTAATLPEWLEHYPALDTKPFALPDQWRLEQMRQWEESMGAEYFSGLA